MRRWLWILLAGCVSTPEDAAPCPCAAGQQCCVDVNRCQPVSEPCPTFDAQVLDASPAPAIVSLDPIAAPSLGGGPLRVVLDTEAEVISIQVGRADCPIITSTADSVTVCSVPPAEPGDGAVDVACTLADGQIVLGVGRFRYQAPTFFDDTEGAGLNTIGPHAALVFGDVNGDGQDDLLALGSEGTTTYLGTESGRFEIEAGVVQVGLIGGHLADFDQDGHVDLLGLHVQPEAGQLGVLWHGTPAGLGAEPEPANLPGTGQESLVTRLIDFDGDGWTDVLGVTQDRDAGTFEFLLAAGGADGFKPVELALAGGGARDAVSPVSLTLLDHDNDGDADLLVCGARLWLIENDAGTLVDRSERLGDPIPTPCAQAAIGDFNRDGWSDIAWVPVSEIFALEPESISGLTLLSGGPEGFQRESPRTQQGAEHGCYFRLVEDATIAAGRSAIVALDVDQDGDDDLFLPTPFGPCAGRAAWLENRVGEGITDFTFRAIERRSPTGQPTALMAVDVDGDGDLDVLNAGSSATDRVQLWRNATQEHRD